MSISTTVVDTSGSGTEILGIITGETNTTTLSDLITGSSGTTGLQTPSFTIEIDTQTLSEGKQFDAIITDFVPQILKEDVAIKSSCNSRQRLGSTRETEKTKVTISW